MKQILKETWTVIERAYDTQEECDKDVVYMRKDGFFVIANSHYIYQYFIRFIKKS